MYLKIFIGFSLKNPSPVSKPLKYHIFSLSLQISYYVSSSTTYMCHQSFEKFGWKFYNVQFMYLN